VFERNRYSVPAAFANQVISLRVYADCLVLVAHGEVIAEHARMFSRDHSSHGKTCHDWRHYLAVVQRKPGALRNGAPFIHLPRSFQRLQSVLLKQPGGDRQMADILALVLHHEEPLVEQAVREALAAGVPTKTHILNRPGRLLEPPRPDRLEPPPALAIHDEPIANSERYDHLREVRHVE
jgi:hypothetical protein